MINKTLIRIGILGVLSFTLFYFKNKKPKKNLSDLQLTQIKNEILHNQVSPYDDEKMWF